MACGIPTRYQHKTNIQLIILLTMRIAVTVPYFRPNTIYCGDCKEVMAKFPNESVDLIYADPPFFSNRYHEVIWDDGYELRSCIFSPRTRGIKCSNLRTIINTILSCHNNLLKLFNNNYLAIGSITTSARISSI